MASETELKLLIQKADQALLAPLLAARGAVFQGVKRLENTYFDTPDLALNQARIALRLRFTGSRWLQTLKTAGIRQGALSQRGEWEMPVAGSLLEPEHLPQEVLKPEWVTRLQPLFTTHFTRQVWLLQGLDPQQEPWVIEVAADIGEVALPDEASARDPISEVELELKVGNPQQLFNLASELATELTLHPGLLSKAARGFRLLRGAGRVSAPAPQKTPILLGQRENIVFADLNRLAMHCLNAWIQGHENWAFNASEESLLEAQRDLVRLHALLVMQQHLYPDTGLTALRTSVRRMIRHFQPWVVDCWKDRALQQLPLEGAAAQWRYQHLGYAERRAQYRQLWLQPWLGQAAMALVEGLWRQGNLQPEAAPNRGGKLFEAACEHLRFPRQPLLARLWLQRYPALIRLQLLLQQLQPDHDKDLQRLALLIGDIEHLAGYQQCLQNSRLAADLQALLEEESQNLLLELGRQAQALWTN